MTSNNNLLHSSINRIIDDDDWYDIGYNCGVASVTIEDGSDNGKDDKHWIIQFLQKISVTASIEWRKDKSWRREGIKEERVWIGKWRIKSERVE